MPSPIRRKRLYLLIVKKMDCLPNGLESITVNPVRNFHRVPPGKINGRSPSTKRPGLKKV